MSRRIWVLFSSPSYSRVGIWSFMPCKLHGMKPPYANPTGMSCNYHARWVVTQCAPDPWSFLTQLEHLERSMLPGCFGPDCLQQMARPAPSKDIQPVQKAWHVVWCVVMILVSNLLREKANRQAGGKSLDKPIFRGGKKSWERQGARRTIDAVPSSTWVSNT